MTQRNKSHGRDQRAAIERAKEHARQRRRDLGLPEQPDGDDEFERLKRERDGGDDGK